MWTDTASPRQSGLDGTGDELAQRENFEKAPASDVGSGLVQGDLMRPLDGTRGCC